MTSIKAIANELNVSSRTLRYYEELKLIDSSMVNNQRYYDNKNIDKIKLIVLLRKINLSLAEIKELLIDDSNENFRAIINNKVLEYYDKVRKSSKELFVLKQLQNHISSEIQINDLIYNQVKQILNQDEKRTKIVKQFVEIIRKDELEKINELLDKNMNLEKLKSLFALINEIEREEQYKVLNHFNYYSDVILLNISLDKKYTIRFIFNNDDIIIGIWLDKVY